MLSLKRASEFSLNYWGKFRCSFFVAKYKFNYMEEKNKTPKYTTIIHKVRIDLELSCNEYCVADVIFSLSNNPDSRIQGWCWATRETIGIFLGLAERSVNRLIEKLIKKGIVQRDEQTRYLKTTSLWYNSVVLERIKMKNIIGDKKSLRRTKGPNEEDKRSVSEDDELSDNNNNHYKYKDNLSAFENFWNEYPRKTGRKKAQDLWKKISPDANLEEKIMYALKEHKQSQQWLKDSGTFIPYPATWLNQERWNDEILKGNPSEEKAIIPGYAKAWAK